MKTAENFSPIMLRTLRRERGLTQAQLGKFAGLSIYAIYTWESSQVRPKAEHWYKVYRILTLSLEEFQKLLGMTETEVYPRIKGIGPEYKFDAGKKYSIKDKCGGKRPCYNQGGMCCIFCYAGKTGIHHVFRELHGGWSRTYTDAQLVGKHIQEVTG